MALRREERGVLDGRREGALTARGDELGGRDGVGAADALESAGVQHRRPGKGGAVGQRDGHEQGEQRPPPTASSSFSTS